MYSVNTKKQIIHTLLVFLKTIENPKIRNYIASASWWRLADKDMEGTYELRLLRKKWTMPLLADEYITDKEIKETQFIVRSIEDGTIFTKFLHDCFKKVNLDYNHRRRIII